MLIYLDFSRSVTTQNYHINYVFGLYLFICLQIILKFLFADNKLIEKNNFFRSIIFKVVKPTEPVDPSIEIFFFIKKLKLK